MASIVNVVKNAAQRPVEAIQLIVALVIFVLAVWIACPWFFPASGSAIAVAFGENWLEQSIVGIILVIPAVPMLLSIFLRRFQTIEWYHRSTFTCLLPCCF